MRTIKLISIIILLSCHAKAQHTEKKDPDMVSGEIALAYLNASDFVNFESSITDIKNKFNQTSFLNMAAEILLKNRENLIYAEKTARKTVELYNSYKDNPLARPTDFPIEDWNRFMRMAAYPYYLTYAKALHQNLKHKKALLYLEKAFGSQDLQQLDQPAVELHCILLEKQGKEQMAVQILLRMTKLGRANDNMKLQLSRLLIKNKGGHEDVQKLLDSLQRNVTHFYKDELSKKMIINVPAPDFATSDLDGNSVSLTSLRGKIIILDFWATWCAPCIAAMPTMKRMAEKNPDVVFLFIATKEDQKDVDSRVRSFLRKEKLKLTVLIDAPTQNNPTLYPIAGAYRVAGIPTKIVIDKNGKIRFSSTGFTTDTELENELTAMITIAKEQ